MQPALSGTMMSPKPLSESPALPWMQVAWSGVKGSGVILANSLWSLDPHQAPGLLVKTLFLPQSVVP